MVAAAHYIIYCDSRLVGGLTIEVAAVALASIDVNSSSRNS